MTADPETGARTASEEPELKRVLVLNHRGDPFDGTLAGLRSAGFAITACGSLKETQQLLQQMSANDRPAVVLLNPVVLAPGGVEIELVLRLQSDGAPTPVILLVDDLPPLEQTRSLPVHFFDFLVRPAGVEELVHRVDLALRTRERFLQLQRRATDLAAQVTVDFKTGLLSERHFKSVMQLEFKRAQRHHLPLSFLLVDVDDFKSVNDNTEYEFGDRVLREVARVLKDNVRETDFAGRFGGDEFAVLLPHTTPAEAVHTAIRIRQRIAATLIESARYRQRVTVSIGIDTYDGRSTTAVEDLGRRANKALHEAKRRGKDQVWLYSEPPRASAGS